MITVTVLFCIFVCALGVGTLDTSLYKESIFGPTGRSGIIANGQALRNQFPFMVSLQREWMVYTSHVCGGTIISHTFVLTAAHCKRAYGSYIVVAGILDLEEINDETQTKRVSEFFEHPIVQSGSKDESAGPDISLLRVESPFVWSKSVQPVYLPTSDELFVGIATLSGWGEVEVGTPLKLLYSYKELIPLGECAAILNSFGKASGTLDDSNVCTTDSKGSTNLCLRDSGSALVQSGVLVGVVSAGVLPCGKQKPPTVYTKSSSFSNWVKGKVEDLP